MIKNVKDLRNSYSSNSSFGILEFDKKESVIWSNDTFSEMLNSDEIQELISMLIAGKAGGKGYRFSAESGEIICYYEKVNEKYIACLYSADEIEGLAKDSFAYKELEKEYQVVLDHIDDGIFVIDHDGHVIRLNEAARGDRSIDDYVGVNVKDDIAAGRISHSVADEIIEHKLQEKVHRIIKYPDKQDMLSTGTPYYENGKLKYIVACERNFEDLELLKQKLMKALNYEDVYTTKNKGHRVEGLKGNFFVTNSEKMLKLLDIVEKMGAVDSTVLLTGESGVGKEVFADLLYLNSVRKGKPFIKANCGAVPDTLWESELFGYEAGSFTGANKGGKQGYFELANGGTLLLDEISEIPLSLQAKLLRVLQEKEIYRLGGEKPVPLDFRVIAATNKNLNEEVKKGNFRIDLYHRLNIITIKIPPLRERKEDIEYLVSYFLESLNKQYHTDKKITVPAIRLLENYDWPGNVRELKNMLERLVVMTSTDAIGYYDVFQQINNIEDIQSLYKIKDMDTLESIDQFKKQLLIKLMSRHNNNTKKVADELSVSRSTVNRMLKQLGIR